jgi:DNA-binding NarL/FixJ family response regulator
MQSPSPRILIVDSHPIIRDGLENLLKPALKNPQIVGCAGFPDALRQLERSPFDLVISDYRIMDDTVLALLEILGKASCKTRCLVFAAGDEKQVGYPCMLAGASGFVSKAEPAERVVEAAEIILKGRQYVSDSLSRLLIKHRGAAKKRSK